MIQLLATVTLGARVARIFPTKLEKLRIELENLANEEDGLKAIGDAMRMSHVGTLDLRANSITPKSLLGFVAAATPSRTSRSTAQGAPAAAWRRQRPRTRPQPRRPLGLRGEALAGLSTPDRPGRSEGAECV